MNCFCLRETFTSRSACRFWTHVTSYPMSLVCCWCRCRHCFLEPAIFCPMWGLTVSVSSGLCVASPSSNIMKVLGHWNYTPLLPSSLLEEKPQPCTTFHVQEGQPQRQPSRDSCMAVLPVLCEQKGRSLPSGSPRNPWDTGHSLHSLASPAPEEKSCSFLVLSVKGLGGGPDIGNDNLLFTHFSTADVILMFICDTIFFTFFLGGGGRCMDLFFKGFIALLTILLLYCVGFSCETWEILVPWPGAECVPPALDHLTTRSPGKSLGYYNFLSETGTACKVFYSLYQCFHGK